jgi:hypothetical protein
MARSSESLRDRLFRRLRPRPLTVAAESLDPAARPFTRWWWFSGPIQIEAIVAQLQWVRANGFGGVEIAWVYPLERNCVNVEDWPRWLSPEWSALVAQAKRHADRLDLGCDFTFGTLWPFGGSLVSVEDAHRTFDGPSPPHMKHTWEEPFGIEPTYVLDHLNRQALERYAAVVGAALAPALQGSASALFCDSWEVSTWRMWSDHLWEPFRREFGYDLRSHIDEIEEDEHLLYDYRRYIAQAVLEEFYRPFVAICHRLRALARVQCHGAPTDLIAAYAAVDIPESEALLFEPPFSRIAASAAALADQPKVSCETFTCLYGFPSFYHKRELASDLKLLADAVIAHGVNQIIWHGMPYNPPGGSNSFFATVHVGPDAAFAAEIPALNTYLTRLCAWMRRGKTYSKLAVYLPWEDALMRDRLPLELQSPAAQFFWEMRHDRVPREAEGFHPLWISAAFLKQASWDGRRLLAGALEFEGLYLDCHWLDPEALEEVLRLACAGAPVIVPQLPRRPGLGARGRSPGEYESQLERLAKLPSVFSSLDASGLVPLVEGRDLPDYWARRDGDDLIIFFGHPGTREVHYPMEYGQADQLRKARRTLTINAQGQARKVSLAFRANESLLLKVTRDSIIRIDLGRAVDGHEKGAVT